MTLDSGKQLLRDMRSTRGTYLRRLVICTLTVFQRVTANVGHDGVGISNIMMGAQNDVIGLWRIMMNVRNSGVGVHNVVTDIGVCISLKFCLEAKR